LNRFASQMIEALLAKRSGLGGIAGFRAALVVQLLAEGQYASLILGGGGGDHLLDVIVNGVVLAGPHRRCARQRQQYCRQCPSEIHGAVRGAREELAGLAMGAISEWGARGGTITVATGN
jgi:hypothetical protein